MPWLDRAITVVRPLVASFKQSLNQHLPHGSTPSGLIMAGAHFMTRPASTFFSSGYKILAKHLSGRQHRVIR